MKLITSRSFEIFDKKTGMLLEKKSYQSADEYHLNILKRKQEKGIISLYCSCLNHVEMKVSKTAIPYLYPATRKKKHSINCVRSPQYEGISAYEKAWKYDEEKGEHVVRMEALIPPSKEKIGKEDVKQEEERKTKIYIEYPNSTKKGEATVFGLATKLNMMSWERIVTGKKGRLPTNSNEVSQHVFGVSKDIRLSNKSKILQEMFFEQMLRGKNISGLEVKKDVAFVYMEYLPERGRESEEIGKESLGYVVCKNAFNQEFGFYVNWEEFDIKLKSEPHSDRYILAGFVYRASKYHHRKLTLGNYCLIPISKRGLFVESNYEKVIYNELCHQKKLFVKPYLPIEGYGGFIPDFIMYEEGKKPMVGEIFGIENDELYDKRKKEKINISKTDEFRSLYRFWNKDYSKK